MGAFESLASFLAFWGGVKLLGQHQQILNQTIIPTSMFLAFTVLGLGYKTQVWFSGFLLFFGGLLLFIQPSSLSGTYTMEIYLSN